MGRSTAGEKSICLPIASEIDYAARVEDTQAFRTYLNQMIEAYPELFPPDISAGYWWHGFVTSVKLGIRIRRIKLRATSEVYQLRPDCVMPYMIGRTDEVEKALYLRRYGVPFEALAYVFGRDESYWYRANQALGRLSLVGTTVRDRENIPVHLVADEKHSWWCGERIYIPTTVAAGCILGVDVVENAGTKALTLGYQSFRDEAVALNPDYRPQTVNTDGWEHTQAAWQALFPSIEIVLCFLHTVLGIQQHCRRAKDVFLTVTGKLTARLSGKDKTPVCAAVASSTRVGRLPCGAGNSAAKVAQSR